MEAGVEPPKESLLYTLFFPGVWMAPQKERLYVLDAEQLVAQLDGSLQKKKLRLEA